MNNKDLSKWIYIGEGTYRRETEFFEEWVMSDDHSKPTLLIVQYVEDREEGDEPWNYYYCLSDGKIYDSTDVHDTEEGALAAQLIKWETRYEKCKARLAAIKPEI